MLIAIGTILSLTFVFWLFHKISGIRLCPICAAVAATWIGALGLKLFGFNVDPLIPAVLIAMSIGALVTKYDFGLFWKAAVVALGLAAIGQLASGKAGSVLILLLVFLLLTGLFQFKLNNKKAAAQPDRFKDCC